MTYKESRDLAFEQSIGAHVFRLRNRRQMTLKLLALRSGVHVGTISRIESGAGCSVATLLRIAEALNVEVQELAKQKSRQRF